MSSDNNGSNEIWRDDLLGRQRDCSFLIDFLSRRSDELAAKNQSKSYVLNINAKWGQGKTFFLKRFASQLHENNFVSVYVNSWTDDHAPDPLVPVISALDRALKPFTTKKGAIKKAWEVTKENGLRIVSTAIIHGTKQAIKKAVGESGGEAIVEIASVAKPKKSAVLEVGEATLEATVDELLDHYGKSLIKQFDKNNNSILTFKSNLQTLVEGIQKEKKLPLFIIIDELDRCRPDYAIKLLERVKHLFDVCNVVFVIATDTDQLGCSVNAAYGVNFDSRRYLLRFFDQSYSFAEPELEPFIQNLFKVRGIRTEILEAPVFTPVEFVAAMFIKMNLSLRDVEQCLDTLENIITVWTVKCRIQLLYLIPLIAAHQQGRNDEFNVLSRTEPADEGALDGLVSKEWKIQFASSRFGERQPDAISVVELIRKLQGKLKVSLPKAMENSEGQSPSLRWLRLQFQNEFMSRFNGTYIDEDAPASIMRDYPRLVRQAGRLSRE